MFKVNQEKLLQDYKALVDKQENGYAADEAALRAFGQSQGWSEKLIEKFIAFGRDEHKGGLEVMEIHKLKHLSEYIEEVADEVEELEDSHSELGATTL